MQDESGLCLVKLEVDDHADKASLLKVCMLMLKQFCMSIDKMLGLLHLPCSTLSTMHYLEH